MLILIILFLALLLLIISLLLLAGKNYKELITQFGEGFQFNFMAPATLYILEKGYIFEKIPVMTGLHHKIILLYGSREGLARTKLFIAQLVSSGYLILMIFTLFSILNNDLVIFYYGLLLAILAPLFLLNSLKRQIEKKQNQIIYELPEFLNKVTLLINAGETVQRAITQSATQKSSPEKSYLYKELIILANQLKNNEAFSKALEDFNKRCGIQEVSIFTTTVLLNYRRGGDHLVIALRAISNELWQKRKVLVRTLGEKASSKLVFPMVLIFIVVLIIVATPAMMLF